MTLKEDAYRYAVKNAFEHKGKADLGAVIGKVMALHSEVKIVNVVPEIRKQVEIVNRMSIEALEAEYQKYSGSFELKTRKGREGLPELDWSEKEKVVTRFAPNPSGSFHFGHARAALLDWEYAKKYNGKFILRFDDTDPKTKVPLEDAEEKYLNDLKWLGIKPDAIFYASDRLEIYYSYLKKLIKNGKAYVCKCETEKWRKLAKEKKACICRNSKPKENLKAFEEMKLGKIKEGEAVLRLKTDLNHKDPSVRDFWIAKVVDKPVHPRVKGKHLWPSYNLASAIDDKEMGISLIIRGQEHSQNKTKQEFIYKYFSWNYPHTIHFGRIKLEGAVAGKSKVKKALELGELKDLEDPRIASIEILKRRGITAEAVKEIILGLGTKSSDATVSIDSLYNANKKFIDSESDRVEFIQQPFKLEVQYSKQLVAKLPVHEEFPEKGEKEYEINEGTQVFLVPKKELLEVKEGDVFRIRNVYNARLKKLGKGFAVSEFVGLGKIDKKILDWVLEEHSLKAEIVMPNGAKKYGLVEEYVREKKKDEHVLLEKFGYARIDRIGEKSVSLWFSHR